MEDRIGKAEWRKTHHDSQIGLLSINRFALLPAQLSEQPQYA
jgi:hypothetical protein